ncbi:MAG: hypothetical protein D6730_18325 [Bacteroidetes bacterium]|nr:MAG: hypothetical protein D6730_18325 [Bacteroidota bacterium]
MFTELIEYPLSNANLKWSAKLVVVSVHGKPSMMLRVRLAGTYFPHRSSFPFVQIGEQLAWKTRIDEQGQFVYAYFDHIPPSGPIEFGYEGETLLKWPQDFKPDQIEKFDFEKLEAEPENINRFKAG